MNGAFNVGKSDETSDNVYTERQILGVVPPSLVREYAQSRWTSPTQHRALLLLAWLLAAARRRGREAARRDMPTCFLRSVEDIGGEAMVGVLVRESSCS